MDIRMQGKNYLVLRRQGEGQDLFQYVCRREKRAEGREYLAVQIPISRLRREMIRYLAVQERNKNFDAFVDYATDSHFITFILDYGTGDNLESALRNERMSLAERTAAALGIVRHLVLSDFPPYFIHAAMKLNRIRKTPAMDFSFAFDVSDFLTFDQVDFSLACRDMAGVLESLFAKEQKKRAVPELETFLYQLSHGEFADTLSVYQHLLAVTDLWSGKEEEELEDKSLFFRLWEKIKALGNLSVMAVKAAAVLLAAIYLGFSIYQTIKPEEPGQGYDQIGDLEIRKGEDLP